MMKEEVDHSIHFTLNSATRCWLNDAGWNLSCSREDGEHTIYFKSQKSTTHTTCICTSKYVYVRVNMYAHIHIMTDT